LKLTKIVASLNKIDVVVDIVGAVKKICGFFEIEIFMEVFSIHVVWRLLPTMRQDPKMIEK
jgi:hypothetical protein